MNDATKKRYLEYLEKLGKLKKTEVETPDEDLDFDDDDIDPVSLREFDLEDTSEDSEIPENHIKNDSATRSLFVAALKRGF